MHWFQSRRLTRSGLLAEPPVVAVYPKNPVELGQRNTLICHVDQFFPPILNVSWFQNGEQVTEETSESLFLPSPEYMFNKYYYLNFVPSTEDVYYCKVEHWGLDKPLLRHWGTVSLPSITSLESSNSRSCPSLLIFPIVQVSVFSLSQSIIKWCVAFNTPTHLTPSLLVLSNPVSSFPPPPQRP